MQGGFQCPYCGMMMSLSESTYSTQYPSFENAGGYYHLSPGKQVLVIHNSQSLCGSFSLKL
jgi:hypothetical protein